MPARADHGTGAAAVDSAESPAVAIAGADIQPQDAGARRANPVSGAPQSGVAVGRRRLCAAVRSWTTGQGLKRHGASYLRGSVLPGVRRQLAGGRARWVRYLPPDLRKRYSLDGGRVDPLRVEIGAGHRPTPGYVHVDADRWVPHVEHVTPAWDLPFADGTVEELLAIHVLEHVNTQAVQATLREWRRVLRPGGFAQIHVPNAAAVLPALLGQTPEKKWTLMVPIFGQWTGSTCGPDGGPDLERHHVLYDFALLESALRDAGFASVEDLSTVITDHHTVAWQEAGLVDRLSLVVRGHTSPGPNSP